MFFKSLRARLQIWYGLILVAVLAGFGITAYELQRGKQFRTIDEELLRRVNELRNALRTSGPPPRAPGMGPPEQRMPDQRDLRQRPPPEENRSPIERPRLKGPPPDDAMFPSPEFHLPPRQIAFFDAAESNGFYFVIWSRRGDEIARSTNAPSAIPRPAPSAGPPEQRMSGTLREIYLTMPPGEMILVGRNISRELTDLHHTALGLTGIGAVILFLGLAGGWYIAGRSIRPIDEISATAVGIASGDLSRRINAAETDSELGRLAAVLNSSFARLESAFEQQRQFASDAAHELRTPVSVLLTQSQTALKRERSGSEYRDTLEACERAAQRMARLIESLLELARLDAGQEQLKRRSFDLAETARDCVQLIQPLAEEHKVQVGSSLPSTPCVGDPERLSQVITNLLGNAVQYNKENGEVNIEVGVRDGFAVLSVSDTGSGIAGADLPHIFKRFYRADQSRAGGRSGLGLAISKAIVEAHGGTIEVSSEPGKGTTFVVRLPQNSS